jgi:hypothetical protein
VRNRNVTIRSATYNHPVGNELELALREPFDVRVMALTAGAMFAAFAIAHLAGLAFPSVEGKPQKVSVVVARVCAVVLVLSAVWFLYAAIDDLRSIKISMDVLKEKAFPGSH